MKPGEPDRVGLASEPSWVEVREALEARGFVVAEKYVLGGHVVDLLCRGHGKSLAVDLVGFPGPHAEAMSLERHLMFQRAGIRLFPLSRLEWETKRDGVLRELEDWISE